MRSSKSAWNPWWVAWGREVARRTVIISSKCATRFFHRQPGEPKRSWLATEAHSEKNTSRCGVRQRPNELSEHDRLSNGRKRGRTDCEAGRRGRPQSSQ